MASLVRYTNDHWLHCIAGMITEITVQSVTSTFWRLFDAENRKLYLRLVNYWIKRAMIVTQHIWSHHWCIHGKASSTRIDIHVHLYIYSFGSKPPMAKNFNWSIHIWPCSVYTYSEESWFKTHHHYLKSLPLSQIEYPHEHILTRANDLLWYHVCLLAPHAKWYWWMFSNFTPTWVVHSRHEFLLIILGTNYFTALDSQLGVSQENLISFGWYC